MHFVFYKIDIEKYESSVLLVTTSLIISVIYLKVSALLKNNNDKINISSNDITGYNDDEKLSWKMVVLKLKPFFSCNVVSKIDLDRT